jgi:LysR family transcriptional regulator of gallate degradation
VASHRANLRHLHTFREVARLGSVSAAARAVHISQPAVTQAITGLERFFGSPLLLRRNTGVALTPAGEVCLARIERSLSQLRDALGEATRGAASTRDAGRLVRAGQLDALGAVVEHGNFSIAARARGISQPSIHRAARELEKLLGVPLFEKTSFGITPTRDAENLARRVRLAFAEIEQARAEVHALDGADSGRTVIGALPLARSYLLPAALLEFTQLHPRHGVTIIEGTYEHLLSGLRSGESDLLIGALRDPAPAADVVQEHLFDDPLAIVCRAGHPLTRLRRISTAALRRYQWIAPRTGSPLRVHFDALMASAELQPQGAPLECNFTGGGARLPARERPHHADVRAPDSLRDAGRCAGGAATPGRKGSEAHRAHVAPRMAAHGEPADPAADPASPRARGGRLARVAAPGAGGRPALI